ncbi:MULTISPECIES: carboxypeptidase regulatory-like domain-containing protein [Microbacterium]|uniref:carboxypeptidase regulatory-like domain-containing protein n=1 Tax=Microbacterium TaxID=33882 RepID=UPI0028E81060|nr:MULTISPECIES: carboxypeptidase regulatory-like domain-containing protein [Microbacterium]
MARRRAISQAVLGGIAALALVFGGVTSASAAAPEGSISGTVTAAADGSPLVGVTVIATAEDGQIEAQALTDQAGAYSLNELIDGDWVVRFTAPGFADEYWNDTTESWRAERVTVVEGSAVTGIDAALAPLPTGSITGTVTREDDGTAVAGVTVTASGPNGAWAMDTSDADGRYTLRGLVDGSHVVMFFADGTDLKREYWQGASTFDAATPVVIADGQAVEGVDATLAQGGAIGGTVSREDDGTPLEGVVVNVLDARNEIVSAATTGVDGTYEVGGIPAGSYRLQFGPADPALAAEYWDDSYTWSEATLITVTELQTVTGVDAALAAYGYISGAVTREADGEPMPAAVAFYAADRGLDVWYTDTASDGTYRVPVVPGTYRVLFHTLERGYAEEYWQDAFLWEEATLVTVTAAAEITGIDAGLEKVGTVTGTVSFGATATKSVVEAWSGQYLVTSTRVDVETGGYSFTLPAGSYVLKATATFADGSTAQPQFFDGVATAAEATPVRVPEGQTVSGIDFALNPRTGLPEPEPQAKLALSAESIVAGGEITVSGTGFTAREKITVELRSDPVVLGTLTAGADGAVSGVYRIPASTPAGTHTIVALDAQGMILASATVRVAASASGGVATPPEGEDALATTGGELSSFALAMGMGLLLAGGLLLRRRRALPLDALGR